MPNPGRVKCTFWLGLPLTVFCFYVHFDKKKWEIILTLFCGYWNIKISCKLRHFYTIFAIQQNNDVMFFQKSALFLLFDSLHTAISVKLTRVTAFPNAVKLL